jgi:uncharacterized membrane protein
MRVSIAPCTVDCVRALKEGWTSLQARWIDDARSEDVTSVAQHQTFADVSMRLISLGIFDAILGYHPGSDRYASAV